MIGAGIADGLASCLMVTQASRWKAGVPPGAISYVQQTWKFRELVIVTADPAERMLVWAESAGAALIVVTTPGQTLGQLRQVAVDACGGDFVATWDDDDISAPTRLEEQIDSVRLSPNVDACCLHRVMIRDEVNGRPDFISPRHAWDPTMVARRESMPEYDPARETGEDGDLIAKFNRIVLLEKPTLYTYRIHGDSFTGRVMADEWWAQRPTVAYGEGAL